MKLNTTLEIHIVPNLCSHFFPSHDVWVFILLPSPGILITFLSFSFSFLHFVAFMDPFKVEHSKSSKSKGSCRGVTKSLTRRSSCVSPPSTTTIHVADDKDQDVSIEEFSANRWESKASLHMINKLRKDFQIPNSVKLTILNPYENMATSPEGSVALYTSMFKVRIRHYPYTLLFVCFCDPSTLSPLNLTL